MAYLFGNNYSDLAQQRLSYDTLNLQTAERDRSARDSAYQFQAQQQQEANRQAQENSRQSAQQYYQSVQDAQRQTNQDQATKTANYQFGVTEADRMASEGERKREFDTNVDLEKKQYDESKNQSKLNSALASINSGEIQDPADISKLHPELTPLQQEQAAAAFTAKNRQDVAAYKNIVGLTPSLNADVAAELAAKVSKGEPAKLTQDEADAIQGAGKYAKVKGINLLEWDDAAQRFVPNASPPYGFQPPAPRAAPTPAPAPPQTGFWNAAGQAATQALPVAAAALNPVGTAANYAFGAFSHPASATMARIRVKSPTGQTGSIPASRLPDYLANGYTQVQ